MADRKIVARALAEALLAGGDVRVRCAAALGLASPPPWLDKALSLVSGVIDLGATDAERLAAVWHAALLRHAPQGPLPVRRWILSEPRMATGRFAPPALATSGEVARYLGITVNELLWFADVAGRERHAPAGPLRHYRYHFERKPSGTPRLIEAPKPRLKALQRRLLDDMLAALPPHEAAHGFVVDRSAKTHASLHVGRALVLRLDLRDFFASVRAARVHALFRSVGYPVAVARLLTGLCTNRVPSSEWRHAPRPRDAFEVATHHRARLHFAYPHLPAGAPSSPALANLCAFGLDLRLAALARALELRYSRYADDLALSFDRGQLSLAGDVFDRVTTIVTEEGFVLNGHKSRFLRAGRRQRLCGVVVNRHLNVPREKYKLLRAIVHNCRRHGIEAQNHAGHRDFVAHLRGRIAWLEHLHPSHGKELREELALAQGRGSMAP
jgi:hypothetical protein